MNSKIESLKLYEEGELTEEEKKRLSEKDSRRINDKMVLGLRTEDEMTIELIKECLVSLNDMKSEIIDIEEKLNYIYKRINDRTKGMRK